MARLSLIICDVCKKQMSDEDAAEEYSVALFRVGTDGSTPESLHDGEICIECFETLRNWLLAPTTAALEKPNKSLSDGLHDMVQTTASVADDAEPAEIKALEPPKTKGERGKIKEGELNLVKSRFDAQKANQVVKETKGACSHSFKSMQDGKIICSNAPPGFTVPGGYKGGSLTGCGKILTEGDC